MIVAGMLARHSPRNKVSAARIKMQSDGAAAYGGRRQTLRGFHEPVTDSRSLFSRCQLTEPIEILRISQQQQVFKQQLLFVFFSRAHRFVYCFLLFSFFLSPPLMEASSKRASSPIIPPGPLVLQICEAP